MKDVAILAGVSQPTVSHVINGTAPISKEVTQRVLNIIEDIGYVPNAVARSLKLMKTDTIAFIIPDIDSGYYAQLAKGVEETAREHGFITFLCNTFYNDELESLYINSLIQHKIAGIIIGYGLVKNDIYKDIYKYNIPFVIIDANAKIGNHRIPSVEIDNVKGSHLAIEHFHKVGVKKICFASEPLFNDTLRSRFYGFKSAMEFYGYKITDDQVFIENEQYNKLEMGYSIGNKILKDKSIDAIFASSDNLAIGIMKEIQEHNVNIPDDIAIIGFDDIPLAELITPSLTSVSQPKYKMAQKGVKHLIECIEGKGEGLKRHMLNPSIIVRKSTKRISK